jgi:hypothetical protein
VILTVIAEVAMNVTSKEMTGVGRMPPLPVKASALCKENGIQTTTTKLVEGTFVSRDFVSFEYFLMG